MSRRWIVITSIAHPTEAMKAFAALRSQGWSLVVVGDTKTPEGWKMDGVDFLSVPRQKELFGSLADAIPYRRYSRKNLGYLYAIRGGAELILETDDDNIPYSSFGQDLNRRVKGRWLKGPGWVNIYKHFASADFPLWPRGLPLDAVHQSGDLEPGTHEAECIVQQFLADEDPDVDAIYRLLQPKPVFFDPKAEPVIMGKDAWSPFNSQNTLFWPEAFPLLYLPCHVSFRMTDIWRSFVALATVHHHGHRMAFLPATVRQARNPHVLMRDFADEVVGYLNNRAIVEALEKALEGRPGLSMADTALQLWESLVTAKFVDPRELPIVAAWLESLRVNPIEAR